MGNGVHQDSISVSPCGKLGLYHTLFQISSTIYADFTQGPLGMSFYFKTACIPHSENPLFISPFRKMLQILLPNPALKISFTLILPFAIIVKTI